MKKKKPIKRKPSAKRGAFVWHDLVTMNARAACDFYRGMFGWVAEQQKNGVFLLSHRKEPFGTIVPERELPRSRWLPFVSVAKADVAKKKIVKRGGKSHSAIVKVPKFGRFAIVGDEQGGVFALFEGTRKLPPMKVGSICWDELLTPDPERAAAWYSEVFGWEIEQLAYSTLYWRVVNNGVGIGGMLRPPSVGEPRPVWFPYVLVDDVDEAARKAVMLGGAVQVAPREIPNVGHFSVLGDAVGAVFAVLKPSGL